MKTEIFCAAWLHDITCKLAHFLHGVNSSKSCTKESRSSRKKSSHLVKPRESRESAREHPVCALKVVMCAVVAMPRKDRQREDVVIEVAARLESKKKEKKETTGDTVAKDARSTK